MTPALPLKLFRKFIRFGSATLPLVLEELKVSEVFEGRSVARSVDAPL